ncbi:MAG TPA: hypothetical protein GX521_09830 [Firmicutes bacterium]|nr:hypothetical protein [Bacillota bacterium]
MNNKRLILVITTLLVICVLLCGCIRSGVRIGYKSHSWGNKMSASFMLLSGFQTKRIHLKEGDVITFQYELVQKEGELTAVFTDPDGNEVLDFPAGTRGEKKAVITAAGRHTLKVSGARARGNYSFEWSSD